MTDQKDRHKRTIDIVNASLKRRYARERRFKAMGLGAVILGLLFVSALFFDIFSKGYTAFVQTHIELEVYFDPAVIDPDGKRDLEEISRADFRKIARAPLVKLFPEVTGRRDKLALYSILSSGAPYQLLNMVKDDVAVIGQTLTIDLIADDDVDMLVKGHIDRHLPAADRRVNDTMIDWIDRLEQLGLVKKKFNTRFFTNGDSREPELAGIGGAAAGSFYTLLVTLALSFPIGVGAALYLEEFAPKNRWTDLIEVNINNLAAVLDRVRSAWPGDVHQPVRSATLGTAGRRPGAHADDAADHHHRLTRCIEIGATIDPRGSTRRGCLEDADSVPSRVALGHAGHVDGHHHRYGAGPGRDRAAADDRHGGVHRGHPGGASRSVHSAACSGLPVGRQPGARLR